MKGFQTPTPNELLDATLHHMKLNIEADAQNYSELLDMKIRMLAEDTLAKLRLSLIMRGYDKKLVLSNGILFIDRKKERSVFLEKNGAIVTRGFAPCD